jgi:hypothetical protein
MNNKIRLIVWCCVIFCLLIISCKPNKQNIQGVYVGKNYTLNIDSIKIMPNGIYERIIYDNKSKLIFKNKGTYKKYESYIEFNEFLLNLNDLKSGVKYKSDDLTNASLNLETSYLSDVKLFVDYDLDYYYLKIK